MTRPPDHQLRHFLALWAWLALGSWPSAVAQDSPGPWTGTWQSEWRNGGALLRLRQSGNSVAGSYPLYEGRIEGTAQGRELNGRWSEDSGRSGRFQFILAPDGRSFMGRYESGEWWSGTRLSPSADHLSDPPDLASPRAALRSFLRSANAARDGFMEHIQPALDTIAFSRLASRKVPGSAPLPQERIEYARLLFQVLDELTFRVWNLPDPAEPGFPDQPNLRFPLSQAGTSETFELRMVRQGAVWQIDPPEQADLSAALFRLTQRREGRPPGEKDHHRLGNPRDTLRTFLEAMERFEDGGRSLALGTLQLDALPGGPSEEDATLLAFYLKQVLEHIGLPLYQEVPNDPAQVDGYVFFRHQAGAIVIAPQATEGGRTEWRFTGETLGRLRTLYEAIEAMPLEPGMREPEPINLHFHLRSALRRHAPGWLRPVGPLEAWQWFALFGFLLSSTLIAWACTRLVLRTIQLRRAWATALANRHVQRAIAWPLGCSFVGWLWFLKIGTLGLPMAVGSPFRRTAGTLALLSTLWLAYRGLGLASTSVSRLPGTSGQRAILASLTFGLLRVVIILSGILLMAEVWSLPYSSVLAGLGIGGLAVALAAQPTLQNMIAGFTLFADNPLSVGDFFRFGDTLGTLEQIGLRSTRIRSLDRTLISLPNSEFANLQLENLTARDRILLKTTLQLRYETTPDQLRFVLANLRRLLVGHPRIHPDPARVRFTGFGAHSLDIEIFAYAVTREWSDFLAIREDVFLRCMDIVREAGTGFAFPSQVNYLARDSGTDAALAAAAGQAVAAWREEGRLPFPEFPPAELRQLDGRLDYPPRGSHEARPPAPPSSG